MKTSGNIHTEIEDWMATSVTGGLNAAEQATFEQHLAECPQCRALYRDEQIMNTMLERELGAARPEPEFAETMVDRFRIAVGDRPRRRFAFPTAILRLAWSRPMQLVYTAVLLAAMVKTGSVLTGERSNPITHQFGLASNDADSEKEPAAGSANESTDAPAGRQSGNLQWMARDRRPVKEFVAPGAIASTNAPVVASAMPMAAPAPEAVSGAVGLADSPSGAIEHKMRPVPIPAGAPQPAADTTTPTPDDQRKLIRNANVSYEVADYAIAVDTINSLVADVQGYLSTQSSDRGENGKLEGTIEVKVPPAHLDAFLQRLHVLGELKSQQISTEDVTKDYFDTDARMHNAQIEEQRLQEVLAKDTGKLADILQVERELARVRQSVDEMQGTLKYYNTMMQYATVTIGLAEKDMKSPAQFLIKRRDDLSIFATDVEAIFAKARQIATDEKAQIADSNVNRDADGGTTATLTLLIEPGAADATISQLKGLGRVDTFTSNTRREAQDGTGNTDSARTEQDKVEAHLTVRHDVENTVQQTNISVQTQDVQARIEEMKAKAASLGAQVKNATFNRSTDGSETGEVDLRMTLHSYPAALDAIKALGEVKSLSVDRQENATATDTAPAEITLQLFTQPQIVTLDNGLWATIRTTLGQGFAAVMWSVRMIGVTLALLAPWAVSLAVVVAIWKAIRRFRKVK